MSAHIQTSRAQRSPSARGSARTHDVAARRLAYAVMTAALLAVLVAQVTHHGHWPVALLGALGPDLALLFGAGGGMAEGRLHPRAVWIYNAVHMFWAPVALVTLASLDVIGIGWLIAGVAWTLHISLDRSVGYGLRDADGFQRRS